MHNLLTLIDGVAIELALMLVIFLLANWHLSRTDNAPDYRELDEELQANYQRQLDIINGR